MASGARGRASDSPAAGRPISAEGAPPRSRPAPGSPAPWSSGSAGTGVAAVGRIPTHVRCDLPALGGQAATDLFGLVGRLVGHRAGGLARLGGEIGGTGRDLAQDRDRVAGQVLDDRVELADRRRGRLVGAWLRRDEIARRARPPARCRMGSGRGIAWSWECSCRGRWDGRRAALAAHALGGGFEDRHGGGDAEEGLGDRGGRGAHVPIGTLDGRLEGVERGGDPVTAGASSAPALAFSVSRLVRTVVMAALTPSAPAVFTSSVARLVIAALVASRSWQTADDGSAAPERRGGRSSPPGRPTASSTCPPATGEAVDAEQAPSATASATAMPSHPQAGDEAAAAAVESCP